MVALFRHKTEQRAPTPIPPLEDRLAVWQAEDERLSHLLETARQFRGFSADEIERVPIALKGGERIYAIVVRAEEKPVVIDEGTVVITDKRVVFAGTKQAREWAWGKCLGVQHQSDQPWTAIAVSNRQKTSGILYGNEAAEMVRFRLDLAYAVATGEADDLVGELEAERAGHAQHRPGAALPPPTGPV